MNRKSLKHTNPYLRDSKTREKLINRSVESSFGVEGIKLDLDKIKKVHIPSQGIKKIYK